MKHELLIAALAASLLACSKPNAELGRCSASPAGEGQRVASEAIKRFIRESQQRQPVGTSLHELTAGIDPNRLEYLGMPEREPGDLLVYEFRAAGSQGPTFSVLVSGDCRSEVNWR